MCYNIKNGGDPMCGRYMLDIDIDEVIKSFKIEENLINDFQKGEKFPGSYIPVILNKSGKLVTECLYWGIKLNGKSIINVRFETADEKPMFKNLINHSRCIIPASYFYEWKESGKNKEKIEIHNVHRKITSLAGIYGVFKDENGKEYTSAVILTVPACESMSHIHYRMPLIIPEEYENTWLSGSPITPLKNTLLESSLDIKFNFKSAEKIQQISFL